MRGGWGGRPVGSKLRHHANMSRAQAAATTLAYQVVGRGFPSPTYEHRFLPDRLFRFDCAWPAYMVAVEIQGGVARGRGAHVQEAGYERDAEKLALAQLTGWLLFYATPRQVDEGVAAGWVVQAILRRWDARAGGLGMEAPLLTTERGGAGSAPAPPTLVTPAGAKPGR